MTLENVGINVDGEGDKAERKIDVLGCNDTSNTFSTRPNFNCAQSPDFNP